MNKQAKSVIYQTPNGGSAQGYIIDEKTYKDKNGTVRVDVGSIVPTAGGEFVLTANGGVRTPGNIMKNLEIGLMSGAASLKSSNDAKRRAIDTATKRAVATIDSQRRSADKEFEDANRRAYQAYMNASNPYGAGAEAAAKLGLANSGYSESSKMKLANTYQQAISENGAARDEYLRELDNAKRDAKYKGDIELANAIAEYEQLVYKHGIDAAEKIAKYQFEAYGAGMESTDKLRGNRVQSEKDRYDREQVIWERALALAKAGFSNSQIASRLGVSLAELYRITQR